jgi:hypothetical protein
MTPPKVLVISLNWMKVSDICEKWLAGFAH